jgi:hypothetical protein
MKSSSPWTLLKDLRRFLWMQLAGDWREWTKPAIEEPLMRAELELERGREGNDR